MIVLLLGLKEIQGYSSILLELEKEGIMMTLNRIRMRASVEFTNLKQSAETVDA